MRFLRTSSALLLLGPLAGCVFLVPSYEPGEHCSFAGETECAKCMRASCQTQIDACCGADACRESPYSFAGTTGTTMGAVDKCAAGAANCATELNGATKTAEGTKVSTCISAACKTQCAVNAALTEWSCETARTGTNTCSTCIYSKCADALSNCCSDSSCAKGYGLESTMSACTGESAPDCVYRSAILDPTYTGGTGPVRKCIVDKCEDDCFGNSRPHADCTLQAAGRYCTCRDSQFASDECSAALVNNTGAGARCFVTDGGCVCGRYACQLTAEGGGDECKCELNAATAPKEGEGTTCNSADLQETSSQTGGGCCLKFSGTSFVCTCTAGIHACATDERTVNSCDRAELLDRFLAKRETPVCSQ